MDKFSKKFEGDLLKFYKFLIVLKLSKNSQSATDLTLNFVKQNSDQLLNFHTILKRKLKMIRSQLHKLPQKQFNQYSNKTKKWRVDNDEPEELEFTADLCNIIEAFD